MVKALGKDNSGNWIAQLSHAEMQALLDLDAAIHSGLRRVESRPLYNEPLWNYDDLSHPISLAAKLLGVQGRSRELQQIAKQIDDLLKTEDSDD